MNEGCLKLFALGIMLLGALLGLLGLIFVIAPDRGLVGFILLVVAVALIAFASSRLRRLKTLSPEGVEQQIMNVAASAEGDVTVGSVAGQTGLEDNYVREGLERLLQKGQVQVERRNGADHYVVPGLIREKMIKKCPYCGNEYPLSQAGRTCPSCGGNLEIRAE